MQLKKVHFVDMKILYLIFFILYLLIPINKAFAKEWENITSPSSKIVSLEIAPNGIYAGEFDTRHWINPFNGIYFSDNFGQSWKNYGLLGRGVKDISFNKETKTLFAATYFEKDNLSGVFKSDDFGKSWTPTGPNVSTKRVKSFNEITCTTTESVGLWCKFKDRYWEQIQNYPIEAVEISDEGIFYSGNSNTYFYDPISKENKILFNKKLSSIKRQNDKIYGVESTGYLIYEFNSESQVKTCVAPYKIDQFIINQNKYYISTTINKKLAVYGSLDCINWESLKIDVIYNDTRINDLEVYFDNELNLLLALGAEQLKKLSISPEIAENPIFRIPFETGNQLDLIEKISSFFDHQYPLLGYSFYKEPSQEQDSTLNFLGVKDTQPRLYYSSHNGIDFALDFNVPVLAAEAGTAKYYYQPKGLGNAIKIRHANGFETVYGHLQKENIVTTDSKEVGKGEIIGYVGSTGNSTGPHLHFEVIKGKIPDGFVDPFSFLSKLLRDPWEFFEFEDSQGTHKGTKSEYLWEFKIPQLYFYTNNKNISDFENLRLEVAKNQEQNLNFWVSKYAIPPKFETLEYVPSTSFLIEIYDNYGKRIENTSEGVKLSIQIQNEILQNFIKETLSVFHWNNKLQKFDRLNSFWEDENTISTITNEFSSFAVLGNYKKFTDSIFFQEIEIKVN
mgnify:CR=1 FL=1